MFFIIETLGTKIQFTSTIFAVIKKNPFAH